MAYKGSSDRQYRNEGALGLVEFQTGGDGHAVGLAELDADDELGTRRPGMTHHGATNAVVAPYADDFAGIETMAPPRKATPCSEKLIISTWA